MDIKKKTNKTVENSKNKNDNGKTTNNEKVGDIVESIQGVGIIKSGMWKPNEDGLYYVKRTGISYKKMKKGFKVVSLPDDDFEPPVKRNTGNNKALEKRIVKLEKDFESMYEFMAQVKESIESIDDDEDKDDE